MKKAFIRAGRGLAWLTAFNMVVSAVPNTSVLADDMIMESDFIDEETEPVLSSVYTITSFPDFRKDNEGHFEKEDIREKFGNLRKEVGTSIDNMEFPTSLTIEGYWEGDSADNLVSYTLHNISWILKSDTDEVYTESSPAGTYSFVPDLEEYLYMQDGSEEMYFEDLKLSEETKLPAITVEITETETDAPETEASETNTPETSSASSDAFADATDLLTEELISTETDSFNTDTFFESEDDNLINEETASEEDIFAGMDDSLIGAEDMVVINGTPTDPTESAETETTPMETETMESDPVETAATETDPVETTATETDPIATEMTETSPAETETAVSETMESETMESELWNDGMDPDASEDPLIVTVSVSDGQNTERYINADTNNTITLTADASEEDIPSAVIHVPCNSALNLANLAVTFMDAANTESYVFTPSENQDFLNTPTLDFTFHPDEDETISYTLHLTVQKDQHTWGAAATCTTAQTCTVCGAENPGAPATGHKLSKATCTKPATCSVCGWTDGKLLPHTWEEATCTTPKTCSVCGTTSGKKLGHNLGDWETVSSSTDEKHGEAVRYCYRENCDYSETRLLNIIADPANNAISGLVDGQTYNLKETLTFQAIGAGMKNTKPIDGDVRYVPSGWSVQNTPGSFMDNYTGSFAITIAGNYTLTVNFKKQIFDENSGTWQVTDIVDSKSVTINVGNLVQGTPVDGSGIRINPQTNDPTVIIGFVIALAAAAIIIILALIYKKKKRH